MLAYVNHDDSRLVPERQEEEVWGGGGGKSLLQTWGQILSEILPNTWAVYLH